MTLIRRPSRSRFVPIRHLNYHLREWGQPQAGVSPLVLVYGWMDVSASYQFVVDAFSQAFAQGRRIIAPDWRGYGASEWLDRPYWFPDYYADLDVLLNHFSPDGPATLVGHSMGANIAATYAAVRPQRVARLAMLDFLGLRPPPEVDAPMQLVQWMDAVVVNAYGSRT